MPSEPPGNVTPQQICDFEALLCRRESHIQQLQEDVVKVSVNVNVFLTVVCLKYLARPSVHSDRSFVCVGVPVWLCVSHMVQWYVQSISNRQVAGSIPDDYGPTVFLLFLILLALLPFSWVRVFECKPDFQDTYHHSNLVSVLTCSSVVYKSMTHIEA